MIRRIFGPERREMAGGRRSLHNEEHHNLYVSPSIIRVIKRRRTKWTGHVERIGKMRNSYNIWLENLKGRDHLEDLGVDGKIL
jgi:hypothetical protein